MKSKLAIITGLIILLLSACTNSESQIATMSAQTELSRPTATDTATLAPTATPSPSPTLTITPTIEPSPTLALPDVVRETYGNIEVIVRDEFDKYIPGFSPMGWSADGEKLFVNSDATLDINAKNYIAFYNDQAISKNEAVVIRFKFAPNSHFTMGIDGERQDERIPSGEPGFRSISMEFRYSPLAYFNSGQNRNPNYFKGTLKLVPDTWYMYTLGFAEGKQFIIKIWDPENPEKVLTFQKQAQDMSNANFFIMWLDAKADITIDDFTIIKFSTLLDN